MRDVAAARTGSWKLLVAVFLASVPAGGADLSLQSAHGMLARAGMAPHAASDLRRVKDAYAAALARGEGSLLHDLHRALSSDLHSLETRDSGALREAVAG